MKIAVIGTGNVGTALGERWASTGHEVRWGVHDPAKRTDPRRIAVAEAVRDAEVVVLAIPWKGVPDFLASAGSMMGKVVIDCINPLKSDRSGLAVPPDSSAAEQIAARIPGASLFKAFNQSGAENMRDGSVFPSPPVIFVAGDDAAQKPRVLQLVRDIGFEGIDAGGLIVARLLEQLAMLWVHLAFQQQAGRDFAFAVVRRPHQSG